jgi:protein-S-isoprenylcysteine O-methyltransferase Ste14
MGLHSAYRGRVMALYVLVFLGTTPIGASLAGWWGEHFGVPSSIWVAGVVCLVAAVAALVWQLRTSGDRFSLHGGSRPGLTLVRTAPDENEEIVEPLPAEPVRAAAA